MNTPARRFSLFVVLVMLFLVSPLYGYEEEINTLSLKLATDISATGKVKVAVVDFTDTQGNITELGRFLAEEFSAALLEAGKGLEVIDRTQLKILLRENKLAETGLIDQKSTMKLGQIAGVEALVSGTITPFGDTVRLTVRALDVNTARVLASARGDIAKTQAIQELLVASVNASGESTTRAARKPEPPQSTAGSYRKVVDDFLFELDHCEPRGDKIECILFITNNMNDRQLRAGSMSRMVADSGLEYYARNLNVGGGQSTGRRYGSPSLATGVRTRASVYFEGVASSVERMSILDLPFSTANGRFFSVQFRDILLKTP